MWSVSHFKSFESQREHITRPLAKEDCKRVFSEQGCDLCLKLFDSPTSLSSHKYMCRLSAPVSLGTTMEPCEEFKYDINSSKENHIGDGTEAIALDCEMVAGGSDGSLPACKGNGKTKILVGHSLENDLDCLRINCPDYLLRDTASYHPVMKTNLVSHPLKYLTRTYLGEYLVSGFHDPYEDCVSAMRLYKRFRGLDQQKEGNVESLATMRAKDIPGSFDSWETDKVEKMTLDELYEMSRPNYKCWCLDSVQAMQPHH
ncbi:hypothetical protein PRUPE_1G564900 [Prunus persica]|uniref:Exonuclease domain-containing protein n=1 Tax=Prunus persica TaxID=3760 RepID=A0A251RIW0_PRUPE|nr:hypothetical protein PRUPE_1G564900 [Prunus persica]